jgi:hypothetical protein
MNTLRQVKAQAKEINNARTSILEKEYAEVREAFRSGVETAPFWIDLSQSDSMAKEINSFLRERDLLITLDDWWRGPINLSLKDALKLATLVVDWNGTYTYMVTRDLDHYNAYNVVFGPTTGSEHTVDLRTPNGHSKSCWQR